MCVAEIEGVFVVGFHRGIGAADEYLLSVFIAESGRRMCVVEIEGVFVVGFRRGIGGVDACC
jgi:hypothetical protein